MIPLNEDLVVAMAHQKLGRIFILIIFYVIV